jgi:hypothetical protein
MSDETTNGQPEKYPPHIELQKLKKSQRELRKEVERANKAINEQIGKLESQLPNYGEVSKHTFDEKHGECVVTRGRHLYESGAQWNPKNLHYGPNIEAPPAPDLWVLQVEYLGVKIGKLVKERGKIKNAVANQNSLALRSSAPTAAELCPGWREDLKAIKTKLDSLRNKRARLSQKLKEQDENWHRKQRLDDARIDRRLDRGNHSLESERLNPVVESGPGCFGRQSLSPILRCESPANLRVV